MNKVIIFLLSVTLSTLSISCKKESDIVDPTPGTSSDTPSATEAITPVGTPEGTAITATIGPAGGSIQTIDSRIRVNIPAGALTSDQTISVQPITNNCPAGTGQAFRLTPHGLTFAKPATVTFQYNDQDINGSAPEVLRIAYQTEKGFWQSPDTKNIDTTARTVTVQTTHYSDWGLFQTMSITPYQAFLNPGENVHFNVYQAEPATNDDDLFVPIPTRIDAKYIDKWTLSGEGTLTHQYNTGDYYAPARIPAVNPAAITVFLNKSVTIDGKVYKDLRLVANVFVAPEGISIQINDSDWQTYTGGFNTDGQRNIILGKSGTDYASVGWNGQPTGIYHWTKGIDVAFSLNKGTLIYQHLYGTGPSVSGGSLRVDNTHDDWVFGTFTVQPAGWVETDPLKAGIGTANIKGVFRVRRVK